ncbi:Peptidoglycan/LPS O-acetylase OafA/YrhL, contains acyltransferase and SGNH-hydrolase domains [Methylobacillus rhizosphaerae]|uniref:Peptidoglycan/LPS O-acetylase OafA/YrhL, contains acyltransferase and SGNH-hydrolase domains n=1 Tax=Methylobacillus rhizosphaerae TaxID=551994 RepID=A0A238ZYY9_9PROT|nr:acyltransferase family protein [Methylobacillus rhizosphaerae]SNR88656.1 Peptidoglycan/LPS O-acetylase OafA/YrhL, contains acyltransferase and SGNH-hydrolase domains [Methylobacillus rhizosphaerae]
MKYRREVDGLRAIAVLAVVFFHAGFSGFSGGYIGVDVFFVISGYLITSILLNELEQQRFSIINFYERRARRILPALAVVLFTTSIAAFFLMPPSLLQDYARSLVSVAAFSSNVFFYLSNGYFSTASEEKPLLHTWSLAVEEQYYLLFPLLLAGLWYMRRINIIWVMLILAATSLALSEYLLRQNAVDANFYLIFSRAWELLAGSLLALLRPEKWHTLDQRTRNGLAWLGLILIIGAVFFLDQHTPFPSPYALIPVLGACLIIAFCDPSGAIGKLLCSRGMVGIGLISYSLYLWHQPLFAFMRMKSTFSPNAMMFSVAIALAFLLAIFSYHYVEQPFRHKQRYSRSRIFQLSGFALVTMFCAGLAGMQGKGFPDRFQQPELMTSAVGSPLREQCHTSGTDYLKPTQSCKYFGKHITWATLGDSHTVELAYALGEKLKQRNEGLLHLSFSGCPPALLFEAREPGCSAWMREAVAHLEQRQDIKHVLIGFSYTRALFGNLEHYPSLPDKSPVNKFTTKYAGIPQEALREKYWQSLESTITRLLAAGKDVYVVYPIPELPMDITKAVTPPSILHTASPQNLGHMTSRAFYLTRHAFILEKLDSLPYGKHLHAIKPADHLCADNCPAVMDGEALYYDDNHLSLAGARKIMSDPLAH